MRDLEVVRPGELDAKLLAGTLSEESQRGLYGRDALEVITVSMFVSREAWAVYAGGELLFIWGVLETEPGVGRGWFMTTEAVARHKRAFWKATKAAVSDLKRDFAVIWNLIDHRNELTLRWAEAMGFTIHPVEQGIDGRSFHRAELRR